MTESNINNLIAIIPMTIIPMTIIITTVLVIALNDK